jgi:hypothetical protein
MQTFSKNFALYAVTGLLIAGAAAASYLFLRSDPECDALCAASNKVMQAQEHLRILYLIEEGKCTEKSQCSIGSEPNSFGKPGSEATISAETVVFLYGQSVIRCEKECESRFCPRKDANGNCVPPPANHWSGCVPESPAGTCSPDQKYAWCADTCTGRSAGKPE